MARNGGTETNIPISFDQGLVTARDPSALARGEMQTATGCEYRVGSVSLHKVPGRSTAATIASSASVTGLHYLQYDTGTDAFVATSATSVWESAITSPGSTFTFSAVSGLTRTVDSPPSFLGFSDRWLMVNGVDTNYVREPNAPSNPVNTGYNGNWRRAGMLPAAGTTNAVGASDTGTASRSWTDAAGAGFTNYISFNAATGAVLAAGANSALQAYDTVAAYATTYAWGQAVSAATTKQVVFTSTTVGTAATPSLHVLEILHSGAALPPDDDTDRSHPGGEVSSARHVIQIRFDATAPAGDTGWTTISDRQGNYAKTSLTYNIPNAQNLASIRVRCTTSWIRGNGGSGRVYDMLLRTGTGSTTTYTTTNPIFYLVTERYTDGDGLRHESRGTYKTPDPGLSLSGHGSVRVILPTTKENPPSTKFVIYRSIDEVAGGYPNMWEVGTIEIDQTVAGGGTATYWIDPLTLSLTTVEDKWQLYEIITVLYPNGEQLDFPLNDPPPLAKAAVQYQGSVVYIPVQTARRVWYSIPTTLSAVGGEQVPAVYNLEFITPGNDTAQSATTCNGGKTMVVYFPNYAMMVSYLPQANDPGVFDARVKEFVSNMRGAAGPRCVCDFTTPQGTHLAAAVDSLGLWATDGVSMVLEASTDFNWASTFASIDLSTAELRNNPSMRRLEFIYTTDAGTTFYELRFFYGEMKSNGQPKITGPDLAGYRSKHHSYLAGTTPGYRGWSGSKSADGKVFYERGADSDASNGYNVSGHVPFTATTGDMYIAGLGGSVMATMGYPKFESGAKTINFVGAFRRDGFASAQTKTKTFVIGTQRKIYWHYYADRHNVSVQDISATSLPAVVGYELTVVGTGDGREK